MLMLARYELLDLVGKDMPYGMIFPIFIGDAMFILVVLRHFRMKCGMIFSCGIAAVFGFVLFIFSYGILNFSV